jgi:hypothetical protein
MERSDLSLYTVFWDTDLPGAPTLWVNVDLATEEEAEAVYQFLHDNVESWAQVGVVPVKSEATTVPEVIKLLQDYYGIGRNKETT